MRSRYSSVAVVDPLFGRPQTLLLLGLTPYVLAGLGCRMVLAKDRNREVAQLGSGNPGTRRIRYSLAFALSALGACLTERNLAILTTISCATLIPYV